MSKTLAFAINALGSVIRVESCSTEVHDALSRYVFPPLPRLDCSCSADAVLRVDRVDHRYCLIVDGQEMARLDDLRETVLASLKAVDDSFVGRLKNVKAVHAGSVVIEDRALLLPGITHAGKSSMVAELLRRGARLLSDEYALIDREGRAHSYPRPLLLRDGSSQQTPTLVTEFGSSYAMEPVPIGWILSLAYQPESRWEIKRISQSEMLMTLLRNTPHPIDESPQMVDCFLRAVSGAKCFAGSRPDVKQAADQIQQLISSPF
jgi:hypothetical protein